VGNGAVIHYHGTPITPRSVLTELAGRNFCVSFAAPGDVEWCHRNGQSVMLDNGAFSFWRSKKRVDWVGYYVWADQWLAYRTTWAVIPDVIDGSEEQNDELIRRWPFGDRGAPVWHMHESLDRLRRLVDEWPRVCIGSSGQYATLNTPQWHARMEQAMNAVCKGATPWLHMLRGMALSEGPYPFSSVDSTDVARNHNRPQNTARKLADRWDSRQCPPRWTYREQMEIAA
jgi:hypothetical protein